MEANLRTKLLSGAAAVALLSLIHASDARAQGPIGTPIPTFDVFVEGGYLWGDGSTNGLVYAEDRATKHGFSIDPGDGWTGRLGAAAHFKGPWSGRLLYTGLAASKGGRTPDLIRPGSNFPLFTVLPNGTSPGVGTSWNQAHVRTSVRADIIDLQAGYDVGLGGGVHGTVLAGLRYGEFNQSTNATFFAVTGFPEVFNFRKSAFHGIGPTLGGMASMPIVGKLSVEGTLVGGLLLGHLDSKSPGNFVNGRGTIITRNVNGDRTAGTFDGQLALTYKIPLGPVESVDLAAGYQVAWYGGVRDTRNGASADGHTFFGSTSDDLLFHGPFMRLGWHW